MNLGLDKSYLFSVFYQTEINSSKLQHVGFYKNKSCNKFYISLMTFLLQMKRHIPCLYKVNNNLHQINNVY